MRNKLTYFTNLIFILLFILFTYHVIGSLEGGDLFGFEYKGSDVDIYLFVAIVSMTFFGAVLGCLYDFLQTTNESDKAWWYLLWDGIKSKSFGASLLATPMIVFVVFDQVNSAKLDYGIMLFCFQSGFFWNRTMKIVGDGIGNRSRAQPSGPA